MSFIFQIKQIKHTRHVAFYEKEEHRTRVFYQIHHIMSFTTDSFNMPAGVSNEVNCTP